MVENEMVDEVKRLLGEGYTLEKVKASLVKIGYSDADIREICSQAAPKPVVPIAPTPAPAPMPTAIPAPEPPKPMPIAEKVMAEVEKKQVLEVKSEEDIEGIMDKPRPEDFALREPMQPVSEVEEEPLLAPPPEEPKMQEELGPEAEIALEFDEELGDKPFVREKPVELPKSPSPVPTSVEVAAPMISPKTEEKPATPAPTVETGAPRKKRGVAGILFILLFLVAMVVIIVFGLDKFGLVDLEPVLAMLPEDVAGMLPI